MGLRVVERRAGKAKGLLLMFSPVVWQATLPPEGASIKTRVGQYKSKLALVMMPCEYVEAMLWMAEPGSIGRCG